MQSENLSDEQLWRAIAQNTNAMTALIHRQLELAAVKTITDSIRHAKLRESNSEIIDRLARNYREYTAELRRRYSLESEGPANLTVNGSGDGGIGCVI
jgi:hypothetical protein